MYQTQQGCSITTGGPDYNLVGILEEDTRQYFRAIEGAKPTKEWTALYNNGTTPVMTFFYNEPWKNDTTGPAAFLSEPEVHMSCLRTVPNADEQSGTAQLKSALEGRRGLILVLLCSAIWVFSNL